MISDRETYEGRWPESSAACTHVVHEEIGDYLQSLWPVSPGTAGPPGAGSFRPAGAAT